MKRIFATALMVTIFIVTLLTCEETDDEELYVIEVTPPAVNIEIDSTQQFTALGKDAEMNIIPNLTFSWTSYSPNVGTIDENGLLSGVSAGITMITAKSGNIESAQVSVNVYDPVFSIVISPETLTQDYGATGGFTALGIDINDDAITGLTFNWESDNTDIASMDENGIVIGVSAGTTTITASIREVESLPVTVSIEMILPSVTTAEVSDITDNTANIGGTVIHTGGGELSAVGVCWSTTDPPTIGDNYTTIPVDTGSFSVALDEIYSGTTYYVRAYATNAEGTGYGDILSFTTTGDPPTVTDIDGNVYDTIQIGDQVWMAENLKVTHYRDGTAITHVIDHAEWGALTTEAYCIYNNNASNEVDTYGALYNWYAVADAHNIAPEGWHVPTDAEWQVLVDYLGGDEVAGGPMKEAGTTHWLDPNTGATNESGFTALPGGHRGDNDMGGYAYFWSGNEDFSYNAWGRILNYDYSGVLKCATGKVGGYSVRLLKD